MAAGNKKSSTGKGNGRSGRTRQNQAPQAQEPDFIRAEVLIILSFAIAVLLFLSNFHLCGVVGNFLRTLQLGIFGMVGFVAPLLLFAGTCFYLSNRGSFTAARKLAASIVAVLVLCGFAQMFFGGRLDSGLLEYYHQSAESGLGGGLIGGLVFGGLSSFLGTIGAFLVLAVLFIICAVCITERSFVKAVKRGSDVAYQHAREDMNRRREIHAERQEERRRLREEQRVRGVNLDSTDLSALEDQGGYALESDEYENGDFTGPEGNYPTGNQGEVQGRMADAYRGEGQGRMADAYRGEGQGRMTDAYQGEGQGRMAGAYREERREKPLRPLDIGSEAVGMDVIPLTQAGTVPVSKSGTAPVSASGTAPVSASGTASVSKSGSVSSSQSEPAPLSPADVFTGKITMPHYEEDEDDTVPFVADHMLTPAESAQRLVEEGTIRYLGKAPEMEDIRGEADSTWQVEPVHVYRSGSYESAFGAGEGAGDSAGMGAGRKEAAASREPAGTEKTGANMIGVGMTGPAGTGKTGIGMVGTTEPADTERIGTAGIGKTSTGPAGAGDYEPAYEEETEEPRFTAYPEEPVEEIQMPGFSEEGDSALGNGSVYDRRSASEKKSASDRYSTPDKAYAPSDDSASEDGTNGTYVETYTMDGSEKGVNYDSFFIPEEPKRVVTASGKVIETDTEALQKKLESKRREAKAAAAEEGSALSVQQEIQEKEEQPKKEYVFPPLTLLKKGSRPSGANSEREYRETAIKLQQTLRNFGVGVTVTNISCGPSVTRYELHPEQGVKVSKIVGLADDIKLSLAAADIRIEAPIPGKSAIGIEVPNKENTTVYLRELLESDEFQNHGSRLAFAVGKDIGGQVVVADIAKMPHLLIAGATGSGKSVCINTLIMSIIYKSKPEDVKLIMVDPKVVELSVYNGIPHLLIPVVTDPKKASGALNWAVAEMTDRYKKFAEYNVRDLKGYNARVEKIQDIEDDKKPQKMPQIVIIVDELADLMMVAPGEVEDSICRLAQLARAAGIHLVIATQRPSVNVITGLIKANVPSRIAFSVASGVDSRTIIDMVGAEKLLGKGDMLFYPSGYPKPLRVQGAFVSDSEVQQVTEFLTEQGMTADYNPDVERQMSAGAAAAGAPAGGNGGNGRDEYFEQAGRFIIEKEKASIGMLQRMFKIGFNRAARIMDQLADAGVVGEEEGTKPRRVLMTMEEFEAFLQSGQ